MIPKRPATGSSPTTWRPGSGYPAAQPRTASRRLHRNQCARLPAMRRHRNGAARSGRRPPSDEIRPVTRARRGVRQGVSDGPTPTRVGRCAAGTSRVACSSTIKRPGLLSHTERQTIRSASAVPRPLLDITERAEGLVPLTIHLLVIARNRHHPQDGDAFFRPILEVRHRAEPCCFNPEIP